MSKRNRHRHRGGPPPGMPKAPRFKVSPEPKAKKKLDFHEWFKPINEAIQHGVHFVEPETDEATVVITTATMFEKMLELAVIMHTGDHPAQTDIDLLFEYPGALSSFAAKTNLCAMLGFLTPEMRQDLDIIRDVRNRFCHSLFKRSFADQDIAQKCARLNYGKGVNTDGSRLPDVLKAFSEHGPPARIQFVFSCLILITMFMLMFVKRFREGKALEPLKPGILVESRAFVNAKIAELGAQKATEESAPDPAHHPQESTAPVNSEEEPSQPSRSSPA